MMSATGGWNTIESDAGVFTYLIEKLGVQDVQFEELVTLEVEELEQLSPVYGVIFLFKYPTDTVSAANPAAAAAAGASKDQPLDGTFDEAASSSLFFAAQTIQNACGTQAILSILLNHAASIPIGPTLTSFHAFTSSFPPDIRGETLTNSFEIRTAHNTFARSSPFIDETSRPPPNPDDDAAVYHFIAYTPVHGQLYELDGLQRAPIAHGPCPDTASFPAAVLPVLRRRIQRYGAAEIRFNLLALCGDLRATADPDRLAFERRKRREWRIENALRAWNALGFAGQVLRGVARDKVRAGNGAYEAWVAEAEKETRRRVEDGRQRRRRLSGGADKMQVDAA